MWEQQKYWGELIQVWKRPVVTVDGKHIVYSVAEWDDKINAYRYGLQGKVTVWHSTADNEWYARGLCDEWVKTLGFKKDIDTAFDGHASTKYITD